MLALAACGSSGATPDDASDGTDAADGTDAPVVDGGAPADAEPIIAGAYYLAPDGDDATGDGSAAAPWFSLERAWQALQPGDTVYLRGGLYTYDNMQYLQGVSGTAEAPIQVFAYPGEQPRLTGDYVVDENNIDLIYLEGNYLHWRGLEIFGFAQGDRNPGWSAFRAGFANYCTFERIDYHHNAAGFSIRGDSTGNLVLNSDFHENQDPFSKVPYDGADGLDLNFITNPDASNTIRGCRAWWNADDGFDLWANRGTVLVEDSWAFYNGFQPGTFDEAGNGTGFKLGISDATDLGPTKRVVRRNLAYRNRLYGIVENDADFRFDVHHNTTAGHAVFGYWFAWPNQNITLAQNNLSWDDADIAFNERSTVEHNSWQDGLAVTAADFLSTDADELLAPRQADGSLPDIDFLHLAPGSDLIDAGADLGDGFAGAAPDLGAFEAP